jgi:TPR repeat protein
VQGKIFINYRRGDDPGNTGRLFDRLQETFAPDQLFIDVDSIKPGLDFVKVLDQQVSQCDVLLAVIGRGWIDASDEAGARRLADVNDFVRIEIEAALNQDKLVIPVLVGEARMPRADHLPDSLKPLARRNAVRLTHERFRADTQGLIRALQEALAERQAQRHALAAAEAARQVEVQAARKVEEEAARKADAEAARKAAQEAVRQAQAEPTRRAEMEDGPATPQHEAQEGARRWGFRLIAFISLLSLGALFFVLKPSEIYQPLPAPAVPQTPAGTPSKSPLSANDPASQYRRALDYVNGSNGIWKSDQEAARTLKLAADQGYPPAQTELGVFYEQGRGGLTKSDQEAARLYKLAADQGQPAAQTLLGILYEQGRGGLTRNPREAARLYKLAADQKLAEAQFNLARSYEQGVAGLAKNDQEAARLYRLAADQGLAVARDRLANFK